MKQIKFSDCHFHDSVIKNIEYDGKVLSFYIPESHYENTYNNLKVEMPIDEYDISVYHIRQYPRFHKVKIKGKEISVDSLRSFFKHGKVLEILEFMVSADSNLVVFECVVFPYSSRAGVYEKIVFSLGYERDYLIFKETVEK